MKPQSPLWIVAQEVVSHWIAVMGSIGGIILAAISAYAGWVVSPWLFTVAAIACLSVAFYKAWLKEHKEVERLQIGPKLFFNERVIRDQSESEVHFRVCIENISASSIDNAGVLLVNADPPFSHGLARIPMHCHGRTRPHSAEVALNPRALADFDIVRVRMRDRRWEITGAGPGHEFEIERGRYRLLLRAHGRDVPPCDKAFIIELLGDGSLVLRPELDTDRTGH